MLIKKNSLSFTAPVDFRLQDNTAGRLDITFNKLTQEDIDDLFEYEDTRISEVFEKVVVTVSGFGYEGADGKPVLYDVDQQMLEAKKDPSIVRQTVEYFFVSTGKVKPGERTSKKRR